MLEGFGQMSDDLLDLAALENESARNPRDDEPDAALILIADSDAFLGKILAYSGALFDWIVTDYGATNLEESGIVFQPDMLPGHWVLEKASWTREQPVGPDFIDEGGGELNGTWRPATYDDFVHFGLIDKVPEVFEEQNYWRTNIAATLWERGVSVKSMLRNGGVTSATILIREQIRTLYRTLRGAFEKDWHEKAMDDGKPLLNGQKVIVFGDGDGGVEGYGHDTAGFEDKDLTVYDDGYGPGTVEAQLADTGQIMEAYDNGTLKAYAATLAAASKPAPDADCLTAPDGSCVSEKDCMHGPGSGS